MTTEFLLPILGIVTAIAILLIEKLLDEYREELRAARKSADEAVRVAERAYRRASNPDGGEPGV